MKIQLINQSLSPKNKSLKHSREVYLFLQMESYTEKNVQLE